MKKRLAAALAAGVLVLACAGAAAAAEPWLAAVLGQYPGAVRVGSEQVDVEALSQGALTRQGVYDTGDALAVVSAWYVARLHLAPSAVLDGGDGCVWLAQSELVVWVDHNLSVLLCPHTRGTRVVVNQKLAWLR
jgi:hypothetical protein